MASTKSETHTARFDKKLLAQLRVIAKREDRSVSYLIQKAVTEFLERRKGK